MKSPTILFCAALAAAPFARAATDDNPTPAAPPASSSAPAASPTAELGATNGLVLNFHDAPLSLVLDYLSQKAGYIVVSDESMSQRVTIESAKPVDKEELRDLLNTVLSKNGYRVSIDGRTLTIKSTSNASSSSDIPIYNISDPEKIPANDTLGTWVMGVHSLDPKQLISDLEPLIPSGAKISANEAGDAIIMTAPGKDVHHFAEILKALDSSAVQSVAVFLLKYGDAKAIATELKEVFQAPDSNVSRANRIGQGGGTRFRGFGGGGGFGGGFPGFGGGGGGSGSDTPEKNAATQAVFTSDDQVNAVVAAAPPELMPAITNVIERLDQPVQDVTEVQVFHLEHADPTEMADELTTLFTPSSNDQNNGRGMGFVFRGPFGGGPGGFGGGNANSPSDRMKRQTQVTAVADPRTSSIIVTAARTVMTQIAATIARLDQSDEHAQRVYVIDTSGVDASDLNSSMQTLFAGQNHASSSSSTTSALTAREQSANNSQSSTAATSFSQTGSGGGGGGGVGGGR